MGRPWITLTIDIFSRMVAGFYMSFDRPGAMALGLCLVHAMLPKETWLAQHDIVTPWPLWGKYLCKINFIFLSKIDKDAFDILNQIRKAGIRPKFDPFAIGYW